MKHVYKAGGDRKTSSGIEYTIKCVNDPSTYIAEGWLLSKDDLKPVKPKSIKKKVSKNNADENTDSNGSTSGA